MQLHPAENWGQERSLLQVRKRWVVSGGMRTAAGHRAHPPAPLAPPLGTIGFTQGCQAGTGAWARRQARGILSVRKSQHRRSRSPRHPGGAAMGCGRAASTMLACLLLLCPLPSPACPAACRCSAEGADCSERALREVPQSLPANTSTLWLGYNFISVLGPHCFPFLPGLLLLSLPHNRLGLIHSQALVGLGALRELDLSNNYLTVLTPETFLPLTSLATLNLGSNRLGELEPGVLHALPQLRALFLQDNPWVCSCSILPLWRWLSYNREKVQEKSLLLCRVPEQLSKYPIMAFSNESFRQCQETSLPVQHYIIFLIIGPFSFMASIFFCTFMGSVIVVYHNLRKESHFWRRPRMGRSRWGRATKL